MAAILGAASALPRAFHGAGYRRATLQAAAAVANTPGELFRSLAVSNDLHIERNDRSAVIAMNLYRWAIVMFALGSLAIVLGAATASP